MKVNQLQFLILFGKTGCGKSEILRHIQKKGGQLLDFEELASHNGSAFGGINKLPQPSQEDFELMIREKLAGFKTELPVWVEFESTYLGKLQIPDFLIQEMNRGKMIIINLERQKRIHRIIDSYSKYSTDELLAAMLKVKKKLSQKKYRRARQSIRQHDFQSAVSVLLVYYDKIYENGLQKSGCEILGTITLTGNDVEQHAYQVMELWINDNSSPYKSENPE